MGPKIQPQLYRVNHPGCVRNYYAGCIFSGVELGKRIRAARRHAGLNQRELAEQVRQIHGGGKFKQQHVSKLETGKSDESHYLPWIARACGVRTDWLAFGDEPMIERRVPMTPELARLLPQLPQLQGEQIKHVERLVESFTESGRA